jgi:hypothetical protein
MRLVYLLPLLLLGCDRALDLPGAQAQPQCPATLGCDEPPCSAATTVAGCEQRSECYVQFPLDEMCNSSGCDPDAVACATGPVDCHVQVTCTIQPPPGHCDAGQVEIVGANGCSWFCVRAALCDPCAAHTDETSCENDGACHARFDDGDDCFQPPCPPSFTSCEAGPALCSPGTQPQGDCTEPTQLCDTADNFVPGYLADGCPDGCVRSQDCPLSNGE